MVLQMLFEILLAFFTALGVELGGSVIGALAAFFTNNSPLNVMRSLSRLLRMWAIVVAIGGTFPTIRVIEIGLFQGQLVALLRQLAIIISALSGAYLGYWIIIITTGGE